MSLHLDSLLQQANPVDEQRMSALGNPSVDDAADGLRDAILNQSQTEPAEPRRAPRASRLRRRLPALAAATAALAIGGVFAYGSLDKIDQRVAPASGQAWAAEAVKVANAVPRLLVGERGWKVTQADEFTVEYGNTTYASGNRAAELNWYPKSRYELYFKDRQLGSKRFPSVAVDGTKAAVFRYAGPSNDFTALWVKGDYFLEVRTKTDIPEKYQREGIDESNPPPPFTTHFTAESFEALVRSVRSASTDDWLAAMPASVVKPQDTRAAIAAMLRDVPQPPGFSQSDLTEAGATRDRAQLGFRVIGAVACGWVEQWIAAKRTGDRAKQEQAIDAIADYPNWAVTKELAPLGDYTSELGVYVTSMRTGQSPPAGRKTTVEASYKDAFGCNGR